MKQTVNILRRMLAVMLTVAALAGCVSNATIDAMNARHASQMQQIQTSGAEQ